VHSKYVSVSTYLAGDGAESNSSLCRVSKGLSRTPNSPYFSDRSHGNLNYRLALMQLRAQFDKFADTESAEEVGRGLSWGSVRVPAPISIDNWVCRGSKFRTWLCLDFSFFRVIWFGPSYVLPKCHPHFVWSDYFILLLHLRWNL